MNKVFTLELAFSYCTTMLPVRSRSGFLGKNIELLEELLTKTSDQLDSVFGSSGLSKAEKDHFGFFGLAAAAWVYSQQDKSRFNDTLFSAVEVIHDNILKDKPLAYWLEHYLQYSHAEFGIKQTDAGLSFGFDTKDLHRLTTQPFYELTQSDSLIYMCPICGSIFSPARSDAKVCSAKCRRLAMEGAKDD